MWPKKQRWVKWVRCSICTRDVPAKVVETSAGSQVTVIYCTRCDRGKS